MTTRSHVASSFVLALAAAVAPAQTGWVQQLPPSLPPARAYHGLVYDVARDRTVLFGGWDGTGTYLNDTWLWDGTTWTLVGAAGPSGRLRHTMAYDLLRDRIVLFGGALTNVLDADDTWEWDGVQWIPLQPSVHPPARHGGMMTYDIVRGVCVLFGGEASVSGTRFDDTWEWNGAVWTQRTPVHRPLARWGGCFVADAPGHAVLYGGSAGGLLLTMADTWTWDGTDWQQRSPATVPPQLRNAVAAFDGNRGVVVMFGGLGGPASTFLDSTWLWDGSDWRPDPRLPKPAPAMASALAYDPVRGSSVLFGGYAPLMQTTWQYDSGVIATWQELGAGCAGSAGTPALPAAPGSLPIAGTTFTLTLAYAAMNAPAVLAFGASDHQWGSVQLPLDLAAIGMPGCMLRTSVDVLVATPLVGGVGSVAWPLPSSPSALGFPFFAQGLVFDAAANPFGAVLSNAGAGIVGAL